MLIDTYKTQRRGGVGLKGADMEDNDFFINLFMANTHSTLWFFTSKGQVFSKKVYNLPEAARTSKGRNLANLISLPPGEKIVEIIPVPKDMEGKFLIIATERGIVKKSELNEYKNIRDNGLRAIKIQDDDNLLTVRITDGKKDVLLCSTSGKIIRFEEEDCRPLGRVSQGVKGINIDDDEKIIGMEIIDDTVEILSVTQNGYGKRTIAAEYRTQARGGKGILAMKLTEKNGEIVQIKPVTNRDHLMVITDKGQVIRTTISSISLVGRNTQGVKLINLKADEKVVAIEKIVDPEEAIDTIVPEADDKTKPTDS
jgi:DNA gyrase subunit A